MKNGFKRYISIGLLSIFAAVPSLAEFNLWSPENGVPVRQGRHVTWSGEGIAGNDAGQRLIAWTDARGGLSHIYAQLYDSDGNALWTEGGVQVSADRRVEAKPVVLPLENGEWAVGWSTYFCGLGACGVTELYVQKLADDGTRLWGDAGVNIVEELAIETDMKLFPNQEGGVIAAWLDGSRLLAQRIDSDGDRSWTTGGVEIAYDVYGSYDAVQHTDGSIVLGWSAWGQPIQGSLQSLQPDGSLGWDEAVLAAQDGLHQRSLALATTGDATHAVWISDQGYTLKAQLFDGDGNYLQNENGVLIADSEGSQTLYNPSILHEDGSTFVGWTGSGANGTEWDLKAQRFTVSEGSISLHWDTDGNSLAGQTVLESEQSPSQMQMQPTGDDGLFLAWSLTGSTGEMLHQLQRIDSDGVDVWSEAATISAEGSPEQTAFSFSPGTQELWAPYIHRDVSLGGLYARLVDTESGNLLLPGHGMEISVGLNGNGNEPVVFYEDGHAFVSWVDNRTTGFSGWPYIQKISGADGSTAWDEQGVR
ncbi:hypothetical protein GF324_10165, partial [bacterium]|nr:hypothetical protein [bacterium]